MAALTECCALPEILAEARPAAWEPLRRAAETRLESQNLPTPRQEDWKYTNLAGLQALQPIPGSPANVEPGAFIHPEARGSRLVFVNGHFDPQASNTAALPPGVRMLRLAQASELAGDLGGLAAPEHSDFFANLNTARFHDGALIHVPRNLRVEVPLHVLFLSRADGTQPTCSLPRLHVVLERHSSLTLVEEYAGEGCYLTNAVVEVYLAEGATLEHDRVQRESSEAFHLNTLEAVVHANARYASRTLSFGAKLSRQAPHIRLADPGAEVSCQSLAFIDGTQLADTHSTIDHQVPHGTTQQLHKAIVDGVARAVFNGKIFVRQDAQQTDAQQQCRTLLLSDTARVDAKPQLEIFADDVKCAHGAAVGQLDPEEVFYLRSRGLDETTARNVLTYGFASEILGSVAVPSLRRALRQMLLERTQGA